MFKPTPTCPLPDIREARIDPTLPVNERLRLFASSVSDPHRFRVGDTAVEVLLMTAHQSAILPDQPVQAVPVMVKAG